VCQNASFNIGARAARCVRLTILCIWMHSIYVDSERGDDSQDGASPDAPLRTLSAALIASRAIVTAAVAAGHTPPPRRHVIVRGRHYLPEPLHLSAEDSGLHLQNSAGLSATLTGAKALPALAWRPYKPPPRPAPPPPAPPTANFLPNENNVYGVAKAHGKGDPPGVSFLGVIQTPQLCAAACNRTADCMSWTWHPDTPAMQKFKLNCFGRTTDYWSPRAQKGIYSGRSGRAAPPPPPSPPFSANAFVADVSHALPVGSEVFGLRINGGRRAIRARYVIVPPRSALPNYRLRHSQLFRHFLVVRSPLSHARIMIICAPGIRTRTPKRPPPTRRG
jgi:hypothetical protein